MDGTKIDKLEKARTPEEEILPGENSREELALYKKEIDLLPSPTLGDEIITTFPLYLPAAKKTERGWESPFLRISNFLKCEGFSEEPQRITLITQIALYSAHLGNPIAVELFENPSGQAASILNTCANLTPELFVTRCPKLMPDDFLRQHDQWKGITIVGTDSTGLEKVKEKLNQFLVDQKLVEETIERTKKRDIAIRYELEGPTACALATKDPRKPILTRPSFLQFYLPEASIRSTGEWGAAKEARKQGERNAIKVSFERLSPLTVNQCCPN